MKKPRLTKQEVKRSENLTFLLQKGLLTLDGVPLHDSNDINCRCVPLTLADDTESKDALMSFLKHIGDGLYSRYKKHPEELDRLISWPAGYKYAVPHAEKYLEFNGNWDQLNQKVIARYLQAKPSKYSGKPPLLIAIEGFTHTHHITTYGQYLEMWEKYNYRRNELMRHDAMQEQCVLYPFYVFTNCIVKFRVWWNGGL